jgi:chorismate synthase (EC 4.2.3.5)
MSTTLGTKLKLTIFGESHGVAIGGVIDGILPGVKLDMDYIEAVMKRRMPGQNDMSTPRKEADKAEILSGVFNGITTGAPIAFEIRNSNQHSSDYEKTKNTNETRPCRLYRLYEIQRVQ